MQAHRHLASRASCWGYCGAGTLSVKDPWIKEKARTWSWLSLWGPEPEVNSGELCEQKVLVKSGKLLLWLCLNSSRGCCVVPLFLEQLSLQWVRLPVDICQAVLWCCRVTCCVRAMGLPQFVKSGLGFDISK